MFVKKVLKIALIFLEFCPKKTVIFHIVFIRICVLHTSLVLFGCISPDMGIAYTLVLSSLVVLIEDHKDLINKHVMNFSPYVCQKSPKNSPYFFRILP
jgi:hypothetical protein